MTNDKSELFMMECLLLAKKGAGHVSPNPMVGAVVVKNGRVIGRGYHRRFGGAHAEVNAIRDAKSSVHNATLYVNLEPCTIFGKTPPCTDFVIDAGISEVVVGMPDPNPLVHGKGISQLRRAGIRVRVGVLGTECEHLNEAFAKFITRGLPFVCLKVAQTLDGKIADGSGDSRWISNPSSRTLVHVLRSKVDAVLVGAGTIKKDNPRLTVRTIAGRNPVRVILDGRCTVNPGSRIFGSGAKTIICVSSEFLKRNPGKRLSLARKNVQILEFSGRKNGSLRLTHVLQKLARLGIASVMVEGGSETFSGFLRENMADKILFFIAPKVLGGGLDAFVSQATDRRAKRRFALQRNKRPLFNGKIGEEIVLRKISVRYLDGDFLVDGYLH
jgi:diaminohydroxyphosphoribosylaminopyrimidine deaminase/5-amino-6-(5-phosphoribosylamino)uracil reductase